MKRKLIVPVIALAFLLTACGANDATAGQKEKPMSEVSAVESKIDSKGETGDGNKEGLNEADPVDRSWYENNNNVIINGVYVAGTDIKVGNYTFSLDKAKYGATVAIFDSVDKYLDYFRSSRFTNGEENDALQANAFSCEYIQEGQSQAVNLQDGNVLFINNIKDGYGTLTLSSGESTEGAYSLTGDAPTTVLTGTYRPGDIHPGAYMMTCADSKYGMRIVVFENMTAYEGYMSSERFTNGEESEAVEKNAWSCIYLHQGDTTYLKLDSKNILMVDKGTAVLVPVAMNWAE